MVIRISPWPSDEVQRSLFWAGWLRRKRPVMSDQGIAETEQTVRAGMSRAAASMRCAHPDLIGEILAVCCEADELLVDDEDLRDVIEKLDHLDPNVLEVTAEIHDTQEQLDASIARAEAICG